MPWNHCTVYTIFFNIKSSSQLNIGCYLSTLWFAFIGGFHFYGAIGKPIPIPAYQNNCFYHKCVQNCRKRGAGEGYIHCIKRNILLVNNKVIDLKRLHTRCYCYYLRLFTLTRSELIPIDSLCLSECARGKEGESDAKRDYLCIRSVSLDEVIHFSQSVSSRKKNSSYLVTYYSIAINA